LPSPNRKITRHDADIHLITEQYVRYADERLPSADLRDVD
jgi:hypothetical protein